MNKLEDAIQKAKWQNWQETPSSLSVFAIHDVRCTTCQSLEEKEGARHFVPSQFRCISESSKMEKNPLK